GGDTLSCGASRRSHAACASASPQPPRGLALCAYRVWPQMERKLRSHGTKASAAVAGRALVEILRQLDSVAVLVVDVQQPNLAVELQDYPDFDALAPQALGLGLHVLDLDDRHAALLVGLTLAEVDLGVPVPQQRPAAILIEALLLETERLGEEDASRLEVADAVPDHNISPGSSRNAFRSSR